jgi:hypothetical protein
MKTAIAGLLASVILAHAAHAATADDVVRPIHEFIDGFNRGDTASGFAAYASGPISIVDEFAPHVWMGPDAAHEWAADYGKHAAATGVTDGTVKEGAPTLLSVTGEVAYVVIPAVYTYKEKGTPMSEEAQMTFVLKGGPDWKIAAWTWNGTKPHPAK